MRKKKRFKTNILSLSLGKMLRALSFAQILMQTIILPIFKIFFWQIILMLMLPNRYLEICWPFLGFT